MASYEEATKRLLEYYAGLSDVSEDDRRMWEALLNREGKGLVATTCVECGAKGYEEGSQQEVHKTILCENCRTEE